VLVGARRTAVRVSSTAGCVIVFENGGFRDESFLDIRNRVVELNWAPKAHGGRMPVGRNAAVKR